MERLTKRITENQIELSAKANTPQHYCPIIHIKHPFWTAFDKLAEYEQAEEDGLLIRPFCKIGDEVYEINPLTNRITNRIIKSIVICNAPDLTIMYKSGYDYSILHEDFGKTVFTTEAETEQALAKMKGET